MSQILPSPPALGQRTLKTSERPLNFQFTSFVQWVKNKPFLLSDFFKQPIGNISSKMWFFKIKEFRQGLFHTRVVSVYQELLLNFSRVSKFYLKY